MTSCFSGLAAGTGPHYCSAVGYPDTISNLTGESSSPHPEDGMDFTLTEEQQELQKWAHEFAEKEIRPVAAHYDETEEFPWPVLKKASEAGLYSIDIYLQEIGRAHV